MRVAVVSILNENFPSYLNKMTKKKKNNTRNFSASENQNFEGKCCHVQECVKFSNLDNVIPHANLSKCQECVESLTEPSETFIDKLESEKDGNDLSQAEESSSMCVCLRCGNVACSRESANQHAVQHYNSKQSHPLVVNLATWIIWCYKCDDQVDTEIYPVLGQCLGLLKKALGVKMAKKGKCTKQQKKTTSNIYSCASGVKLVKGLVNLGNTCFFNSVMQNLCQTQLLCLAMRHVAVNDFEYCISPLRDNKDMDPLTVKVMAKPGPLTSALAKFLQDMTSESKTNVLNPGYLFTEICKKAPRFKGFRQQDSQELLRYLLDSVREEEIKGVKRGILRSFDVKSSSSDKGISEDKVDEDVHEKIRVYGRNASAPVIDSLFGGQLVSSLECRACHKVSTIMERFFDLSLSLAAANNNVSKQEKTLPATKKKEPAVQITGKKNTKNCDKDTEIKPKQAPAPSKHQLKKAKKKNKKRSKHRHNSTSKGERKQSQGSDEDDAEDDVTENADGEKDVTQNVNDDVMETGCDVTECLEQPVLNVQENEFMNLTKVEDVGKMSVGIGLAGSSSEIVMTCNSDVSATSEHDVSTTPERDASATSELDASATSEHEINATSEQESSATSEHDVSATPEHVNATSECDASATSERDVSATSEHDVKQSSFESTSFSADSDGTHSKDTNQVLDDKADLRDKMSSLSLDSESSNQTRVVSDVINTGKEPLHDKLNDLSINGEGRCSDESEKGHVSVNKIAAANDLLQHRATGLSPEYGNEDYGGWEKVLEFVNQIINKVFKLAFKRISTSLASDEAGSNSTSSGNETDGSFREVDDTCSSDEENIISHLSLDERNHKVIAEYVNQIVLEALTHSVHGKDARINTKSSEDEKDTFFEENKAKNSKDVLISEYVDKIVKKALKHSVHGKQDHLPSEHVCTNASSYDEENFQTDINAASFGEARIETDECFDSDKMECSTRSDADNTPKENCDEQLIEQYAKQIVKDALTHALHDTPSTSPLKENSSKLAEEDMARLCDSEQCHRDADQTQTETGMCTEVFTNFAGENEISESRILCGSHSLGSMGNIKTNVMSVESCLKKFCSPEILDGNDKFICEECNRDETKKEVIVLEQDEDEEADEESDDKDTSTKTKRKPIYTEAVKQLLIHQAPPILTLHLKRFHQVGYSLKKLAKHVDFPLVLDLAPFCHKSGKIATDSEGRVLYALSGIVEHTGGLHSGHYTAYCRVPTAPSSLFETNFENLTQILEAMERMWKRGGKREMYVHEGPSSSRWFHISDGHVSEVSEERVLKAQAYLLFYERIVLSHGAHG